MNAHAVNADSVLTSCNACARMIFEERSYRRSAGYAAERKSVAVSCCTTMLFIGGEVVTVRAGIMSIIDRAAG